MSAATPLVMPRAHSKPRPTVPSISCSIMEEKNILRPPFTTDMIAPLRAGDMLYISGTIYTARDAAHLRLCEMLKRGEEMPFDFDGQVVYYAGPCPAKPGQAIGSVGPTTGGRMDAYSP